MLTGRYIERATKETCPPTPGIEPVSSFKYDKPFSGYVRLAIQPHEFNMAM